VAKGGKIDRAELRVGEEKVVPPSQEDFEGFRCVRVEGEGWGIAMVYLEVHQVHLFRMKTPSSAWGAIGPSSRGPSHSTQTVFSGFSGAAPAVERAALSSWPDVPRLS
jgi:hypothetical protein